MHVRAGCSAWLPCLGAGTWRQVKPLGRAETNTEGERVSVREPGRLRHLGLLQRTMDEERRQRGADDDQYGLQFLDHATAPYRIGLLARGA
jgi:hypothetical protein